MKKISLEFGLNNHIPLRLFKDISVPLLALRLITPRIRVKTKKSGGYYNFSRHFFIDVPIAIEYYSNECLFGFRLVLILGIEIYYEWKQ